MAKQAGVTHKQGRELGPCEIMVSSKKTFGMMYLRRYSMMRLLDEERLRQRIGTRSMPGNYTIMLRYGNPTLEKLITVCDALGVKIQLVRKDGEIL